MAVVPATHTFVAGAAPSSEMNTYVRDVLNYLLARPRAVLRQTVAQSITNNVWTGLTFDVEDLDTDVSGTGGHSTSVNTSRYAPVYAGWYSLLGVTSSAAGATGQRGARWAVNGTAINPGGTYISTIAAGGPIVPAVGQLVFLNVGDYVELQTLQNNGGALNTNVASTAQPTASIIWESN